MSVKIFVIVNIPYTLLYYYRMTTPMSHAPYTKFKIAQNMKVYQTHPTNIKEEEKRGPHPTFRTTVAQLVRDSTI